MTARSAAVAGLVGLVALAAVWVAYVHLWRRGDPRPLRYRDASARLRGFAPVRPLLRVFPAKDPNETLVLVASGPRSSDAYRLDVARVVEERGRVVVTVREHTPTLANPGHARVTYPYRLIVLPTHGKHVHVHWEGRP
jgi:hypothetical protein